MCVDHSRSYAQSTGETKARTAFRPRPKTKPRWRENLETIDRLHKAGSDSWSSGVIVLTPFRECEAYDPFFVRNALLAGHYWCACATSLGGFYFSDTNVGPSNDTCPKKGHVWSANGSDRAYMTFECINSFYGARLLWYVSYICRVK